MSFNPSVPKHRPPRFLVGALATTMTVVPLIIGFFASPTAAAATAAASKKTFTCTYEGKDYPGGSVIEINLGQGKLSGQRICVEDSNGRPFWTRTNSDARQRSERVITLDSPLPTLCEPAASSSPRYCACQGGLFSIGAIVNSANGKLRCDKGKWRPATPEELGLRGKSR
jgi:hypothetical protein